MSDEPVGEEPEERRTPVDISVRGNGFAFVSSRVLVWGDESRDRAVEIAGPGFRRHVRRLVEEEPWYSVQDVGDPVTLVDALRSEGRVAQPDHILFAHSCGGGSWANPCGCGSAAANPFAANPFAANPFAANPFAANPFAANPFAANPFAANPFAANPLRANPFAANRPMENTARPAGGPELPQHSALSAGVEILVLDSGLASPDANESWKTPALITAAANRVSGDQERPDTIPPLGDKSLDPVAGHGTFIAGLIEQLAPGCTIRVVGVVDPLGRVEESRVVDALRKELDGGHANLVSMSFGGQLMENTSSYLRSAIARLRRRGTVLVASAGNDGTCVPQFPAAFQDVLAVGALGPCGPAAFTNWGDWVDASAPGVDLVSAFFDGFDGRNPQINGIDIDHFTGWARWSGTSFAAPVVVAALAREMARSGGTADEAVQSVIRAPHLFRLPCLGTVVNL